MKALLFIIGMLGAGLIGFSFEPNLRMTLTGKAPGKKKADGADGLAGSGILPAVIDLSKWPADRLPKKVLLKKAAEVSSKTDDIKMTIPSGSRVDLLRLEGGKLVISPGGDAFEGLVLMSDTDLPEQITELAKSGPIVEEQPVVTVDAGNPEVMPVPEPQPEVMPKPEVVVEVTKPEVVPLPEVTPEPEVVTEPASPTVVGDVVGIMQASIKNGEIKEFQVDQVLEWLPGGEETVEGETYVTGTVNYKKDTVFGLKTIQAKALIKNGKVVRWLWPKSGMVIN